MSRIGGNMRSQFDYVITHQHQPCTAPLGTSVLVCVLHYKPSAVVFGFPRGDIPQLVE